MKTFRHFKILLKSTAMILFLAVAACSESAEEKSEASKLVKSQAEEMVKYFLKKDFDTFLSYSHPRIAELAGGVPQMKKLLEDGISNMETGGTTITDIKIGEASKIVTAGDQLQCTITQNIEMKVPDGKLHSKSTLLAISKDNGKNWLFADCSSKSFNQLKEIFPDLSNEIILPAYEEPVFSKD